MNSTLILLVLATAMVLVSCLVCPVDYCDRVECHVLTAENCTGKIVPRGTYCGCCDSCRHILEPGQNCFALLLHGMPPTVTCPDGYFCDSKTITCEKQVV
ncbi:hypothetical protein BsWGS_25435 [Bradybaena similaris]